MRELPQRKATRLKNYDYSKNGYYFIAICCKNKACVLGEIIKGEMRLSECGSAVERELQNVDKIRAECHIETYVIMPNHIHLILRIRRSVIVGTDGNSPNGLIDISSNSYGVANESPCNPAK